MMRREGLTIDSQTLWDQLEALATVLQPTYEALRRHVLAAPVIGADETWWRLLRGARGQALVGVERHARGRRRLHDPREPLAGGGARRCSTATAASSSPTATAPTRRWRGPARASRWPIAGRTCAASSSRRSRTIRGRARRCSTLIGQLYAVERACPLPSRPPVTRTAPRRSRAAPRRDGAVDGDRRGDPRLGAAAAGAAESSLGKAIAYMLGLWPGLTRFLDDPRIPLDNNATERGLRGMVVGRKNHYGSRSQRGTEVAALFYSLIESAKLCGVEPKAYLLRATRAALATPGTVTLPHDLLTPA